MRRLILFTDLYTSFERGEQFGLLLRNLSQYEKFLQAGSFDEIYYFTYDDRDTEKLAQLKRDKGIAENIRALTPPRILRSRLGAVVYSVIGPFLHYRVISRATVLRTQQVSGAWTALIAKAITGRPLLFRLGYPLSIRFKTEGKRLNYLITTVIERLLVRFSDHVAVTSRAMQAYYGGSEKNGKVTVLPSYVDVSGFTPISDYDANKPILFVGRLNEVKNIGNLILACSRLKVALHLYGRGPLKEELKATARACGADVSFKGVVPNSELMRVHHEHTIFVLCSTREGMPKALIEAMASGLICVVTRTDGALELVEDGVTGHLIDGFDADAIEKKLSEVLASIDPEVGRRASAFVRRNNSLEHAVDLELGILDDIIRGRRQPAAAAVER